MTTQATAAQHRHYQLAKQHFLRPATILPEELVREQLGLHSTDYWTPYLSTWARLRAFDAAAMFEQLNTGSGLARFNAFRGTLHVVHASNISVIVSAIASWHIKRLRSVPPLRARSDEEVEGLIQRLLDALALGPQAITQLKKAVPEAAEVTRWLLLIASARGLACRATASHARSNRTTWARCDTWLGATDLELKSEQEGLDQLLDLYVARFGPVTVDDASWWAPTTKTAVRAWAKRACSRSRAHRWA